MACPITTGRTYPLQQPDGWNPKYPRFMLRAPDDIREVAIAYIGVQTNNPGSQAQSDAVQRIKTWADSDVNAPVIVEKFEVISGYDTPGSQVLLCYWKEGRLMQESLNRLQLERVHESLGDEKPAIGLWCEQFSVDIDRFETIYSGTDYQPGFAKVTGGAQVPHEYTGYFGAARDRFQASAHDLFEKLNGSAPPDFKRPSVNTRVAGDNDDVLVHIRSGQFWENCPEDERDAYESNLQPVLRNGMEYLCKNAEESGDSGLRILRNLPVDGRQESRPRRETCTAGFFRSLKDLEYWAKSHPTHHKIYNGVHAHASQFGRGFKLRTWHEVCIVKPGEARFQYINCEPTTGVIPFIPLHITEPN